MTNKDTVFRGYIFDIDAYLDTECGGHPDNSNTTTIEIKGFSQPVVAENLPYKNGYGIRIQITGDWESEDFMRALKDLCKMFELAKADNAL